MVAYVVPTLITSAEYGFAGAATINCARYKKKARASFGFVLFLNLLKHRLPQVRDADMFNGKN